MNSDETACIIRAKIETELLKVKEQMDSLSECCSTCRDNLRKALEVIHGPSLVAALIGDPAPPTCKNEVKTAAEASSSKFDGISFKINECVESICVARNLIEMI